MAKAPVPERTFPRGGSKPQKRDHPSVDFSLFKRSKKQTVNSKKPKKKGSVGSALSSSVQDLEVVDVRPGMCILGCVDNITPLSVELSLPGGLRAIVKGTNINSQFTGMIQDNRSELPALSELFHIGDNFPVSIISRSEQGTKQFVGSLNPKDVNGKITPRHLRKSLTLNGAVESVEDHGIVIDVGISKVAAFMPYKSARHNFTYVKGQLVYVQITSVKTEGHAIIVADVRAGKILTAVNDDLPLHCFLPGIKWTLIVTRVLKGGVEVGLKGLGPEMKGFVHVTHLSKLFDKATNYETGKELPGILLYIMPVVNVAYFQVASLDEPNWSLSFGSIAKDVRIVRVGVNGLTGKVATAHGEEKCFIPIHRIDAHEKIIAGSTSLRSLFQVGTILPKVRIEWPSRMSRFYFAAIDRASLSDTPYTKGELKVGQVVKCVLRIVGAKYSTVEIRKTLKGFVAHEHMSDKPGEISNFKPGMKCTARVLSLDEGDRVKLTLKKSLVKAERVLSKDSEIKSGDSYPGFVRFVEPHRITVEFFGGLKTVIPRERLPFSSETSLSALYKIGQVVNCYVVEDGGKLMFSLIYNEDIAGRLTVGTKYLAEVSSSTNDGLYLTVEVGPKTTCSGFMPKSMMASMESVAKHLINVNRPGSKLKVICVNIDPLRTPASLFTMHPAITSFYKNNKLALKKGEDTVKENAVVPFIVLTYMGRLAIVPAVPHSKPLKPRWTREQSFKNYQVVVGRVTYVNDNIFKCTTSVEHLWEHNYVSSLELLASFLGECESLQNTINSKQYYPQLHGRQIGEIVDAVVESFEDGVATLTMESKRKVAKCREALKPGSEIRVRVVWIDYQQDIVWVRSLPSPEYEPRQENRSNIRARIVYSGLDVAVAEALGSGELVFIPTRKHLNEPPVDTGYQVGERTKLLVHRLRSKLCGLDKKIALNCERKVLEKAMEKDGLEAPPTKKPKVSHEISEKSQTEPDVVVDYVKEGDIQPLVLQEVKQEPFSDEELEVVTNKIQEVEDDSDAEIKLECDSRDGMEMSQKLIDSSETDDSDDEMKPEPVDLDVGFDWSVAENPDLLKGALSKAVAEDSSSDDEEDDKSEKKKKKRLSGSEKREKAREAEERLRAREEALVDPTRPPQSADDFDRLTVSTPDDSSLWLKYMAFHLENTEIEKARAVARRALKVISFREEQEKLNVWLALLNLEQLYGTAESQKDTLDEALRCNEPYKIHSHKLNALVDSGAGLQAEQLANVMLKKYGETEEVWCEVGGALMRLGKLDYARKVLQRGMSSLPPTKHVSLITRFAQLENKYGSNERAQTLYENVITLFPKRVDVWSAYVDILIKIGNIDFARTTLERSVSQSLPPKKMKVLFKKFLTFEETHGTPENAEKVRQAAAEYVESVGSND